jgi:hypothetical protein
VSDFAVFFEKGGKCDDKVLVEKIVQMMVKSSQTRVNTALSLINETHPLRNKSYIEFKM